MNKNHYPWWGYVRHIVREYQRLVKTENLSGVALRNWEAVQGAVDTTWEMPDGSDRLEIIRKIHWDRTHTLEGASRSIPCGKSTAIRWQRAFFEEVARNRGLLD